MKYCCEIDSDDIIPLINGKIFDVRYMLDPGIIHQDVNSAQVCFCITD